MIGHPADSRASELLLANLVNSVDFGQGFWQSMGNSKTTNKENMMEIGFEIAIKGQRGTYVWESEIVRALSDYFGVEVTAIEKVEITN